ncbi:hypothetical protein CDD80_957 [Ophiocordyceps camponoti-rufipedis]|uniref:Uncharacterized protein n=1 Tax=Ophiocordyceps camponoti-rufipedis TaxID=2004952 RepID=A0A2C5YG86_9HYPO|nr:hypothetical protein CDD80_957 [Ophiocordyceps camponoti-rufipedis]
MPNQTTSNPKREKQPPSKTSAPKRHLPHANRPLGEPNPQVIDQMLNPHKEMKGKGKRQRELDGPLCDEGPGREARGKFRAAQVQAQQRGDEVAGKVDVGGAGEGAAGDAGPCRRAEPRLRGLVDGEVGGDGPVEALGGEDLVGLVGGEGCGC